MPRSYGFEDRLAMSTDDHVTDAITSIILREIPGALNVLPAHTSNDRKGTDFWVEHSSGRFLRVDAKVREEDWAARDEDDYALEIWSVVERQIPGWTRSPHQRTDYILWFWKDTCRSALVSFPMLCAVFCENLQAWSAEYRVAQQRTDDYGDYHSECVFVPRHVVWREIYKRFSSHLPTPQE